MNLASGLAASQTTESALSSTMTLSVLASDSLSVFLIDANVERQWTHLVLTLSRAVSTQGAFLAIPPLTSNVAVLEPSGLDSGDEKRPDGITVYPYSRGRCLIWDVTCVNTFASPSLVRAVLAAGSVADAAEVKIAKYAEVGRRFIFRPVAVETSGAMGKSTIMFFNDLGRRHAVRFQDQR